MHININNNNHTNRYMISALFLIKGASCLLYLRSTAVLPLASFYQS